MTPSPADMVLLAASPLGCGVAPEPLQRLLAGVRIRAVDTGTRVLDPGARHEALIVVLSGALGLFADESARLPLAVLGPGECIGEQALIDPRSSAAGAVAATETSRLAVLDIGRCWEAMRGAPVIALNVLERLAAAARRGQPERQRAFETAAGVDAVTGLHNRRWMDEMFERELLRCERGGLRAALLMVGVDHLEQINRSLGHAAGDRLLLRLAELVQRSLRPHDLCARRGGDEICVLLPEIGLRAARQAAERMRERIAAQPAALSQDVQVAYTVSIGVAEWNSEVPLDQLLRAAASALRAAKQGGRNRIEVATP